jgi:hypothetical protein
LVELLSSLLNDQSKKVLHPLNEKVVRSEEALEAQKNMLNTHSSDWKMEETKTKDLLNELLTLDRNDTNRSTEDMQVLILIK